MFGMFFFLTIFVQTVWGYSALKTGIAYLPLVTAAKAGHPLAGTAAQVKAAIYDHALSVGFGRGFEVSAGIMLIALIVTIAAVRVRRADLAGAQAAQASPAAIGAGYPTLLPWPRDSTRSQTRSHASAGAFGGIAIRAEPFRPTAVASGRQG